MPNSPGYKRDYKNEWNCSAGFKGTSFQESDRKVRSCGICEQQFIPNSGVQKYCSIECRRLAGVNTGSTEEQYLSISGNWKRYFQRLCNRSNKRDDISYKDCLEILEKQEGKCALSGVELTCKLEKGTKFKTNASLDRIEAGGPYIKENVQLVCSALNSWRSDTDLSEFIWWCQKVAQFQEKEE